MTKICKRLGVEIPEYDAAEDPTKLTSPDNPKEWTISALDVKAVEKNYNAKIKEKSEQKKLLKNKFTFFLQKDKSCPPAKRGRARKNEDDSVKNETTESQTN